MESSTMKIRSVAVSLGLFAVLVTGCAKQEESPDPVAEVSAPEPTDVEIDVNHESKSDSGVTGTAAFSQQNGEILLHIDLANTPPGEHAFHIHQTGDCSSPDGKSAGGHWNPMEMDHGAWAADPHHLGDVGNIVVGEDGTGTFHMSTDAWSIGTGEPNDITGKAVILHAGIDDFTSQPTGAAGGRIACGVIQ
jgi:Cu-Zn family superoxide dismutase